MSGVPRSPSGSKRTSPALPLPPTRSTTWSSAPGSSAGSAVGRRNVSIGSLPPPPPIANFRSGQSQLSQNMAKSMTIEEMRQLHHRALCEAEAKRTELRLVLASRYRELVGSSDEVIKMKERAQELNELVHALPSLMEKLALPLIGAEVADQCSQEEKRSDEYLIAQLREQLSLLPRAMHRALDENDVHHATVTLIDLFSLISAHTKEYALANILAKAPVEPVISNLEPSLEVQMRMIFFHVESIPVRIGRLAEQLLLNPASYGSEIRDPFSGAQLSAAALASLNLLALGERADPAAFLLDRYFDSKTKLIVSLLNKLAVPTEDEIFDAMENAEGVLSKIVLILQHDIIMHPYQIFVRRNFNSIDSETIMESLPLFHTEAVQSKCTKFLASHLPLIRAKVKNVLVNIAGTTASALGQIRQSLYDKTDGAECMEFLNENGGGTWNHAVDTLVDLRTVAGQNDLGVTTMNRFSLWGTLFSHAFSSLVHSILTTSFQSVHSSAVATLRASLANAPPLNAMLPHEAYRNALKIAMDLNDALLKVSNDAHELLVHAEEREESERRLRQSLYVQTCEIMGRIVSELRRMVAKSSNERSDATKEFLVGRLCFLLKYRLTCLHKLLDPSASPGAGHRTGGMIALVDLQSAFELADDDEDGIITMEEATQAAESAFSGTQFRGAEMLRETLLLSDEEANRGGVKDKSLTATLKEMTLLTARGLYHDREGSGSGLGAVQESLDEIVNMCFQEWARSALASSGNVFLEKLKDFWYQACTFSESEWLRLYPVHGGVATANLRIVSQYVSCYLLDVASLLSRSTCPSDSLAPVPNMEYAVSLSAVASSMPTIPTFFEIMRCAIMHQALRCISNAVGSVMEDHCEGLSNASSPAQMQLSLDLSFLLEFLFQKNKGGFGSKNKSEIDDLERELAATVQTIDSKLETMLGEQKFTESVRKRSDRHQEGFQASGLLLSALLGNTSISNVSSAGEVLGSTSYDEETNTLVPFAASRRFILLPVQADRSIADIKMKEKYARERKEDSVKQEAPGSGMMSSGLGFLSSMLKKK